LRPPPPILDKRHLDATNKRKKKKRDRANPQKGKKKTAQNFSFPSQARILALYAANTNRLSSVRRRKRRKGFAEGTHQTLKPGQYGKKKGRKNSITEHTRKKEREKLPNFQ